jgi:hypothetical protein
MGAFGGGAKGRNVGSGVTELGWAASRKSYPHVTELGLPDDRPEAAPVRLLRQAPSPEPPEPLLRAVRGPTRPGAASPQCFRGQDPDGPPKSRNESAGNPSDPVAIKPLA